MIRLIVSLLNLLIILILQVFPGNVSVKMDVPAQVNAGSEFEVRITLNQRQVLKDSHVSSKTSRQVSLPLPVCHQMPILPFQITG